MSFFWDVGEEGEKETPNEEKCDGDGEVVEKLGGAGGFCGGSVGWSSASPDDEGGEEEGDGEWDANYTSPVNRPA